MEAMSAPGCPKSEFRSAQHEGTPANGWAAVHAKTDVCSKGAL